MGRVGDPADDTSTDALGLITSKSYNADGTLAQVCNPPNGSVTHCTSYAYDANGNQIKVTDALGKVTQYLCYPDNLRMAVIDNAGDETFYTYDPVGNQHEVISPNQYALANGRSTVYYFTNDNLLQTTVAAPLPRASTSTACREASTMARGERPRAMASDGSTSFGYDGLGRMSSPGSTNYQNDAFDRQRSVGSSAIHYDGFSQRPTIETTGSTARSTRSIRLAGRRRCRTAAPPPST